MKYILLLFISALFSWFLMTMGIDVNNIIFWIATFIVNGLVYYILFEHGVDKSE